MTDDEYRKRHYKWLRRARKRAADVTTRITLLEYRSMRYNTLMAQLGGCLSDLFAQNIYRKMSFMATTEIFFEMLIQDLVKAEKEALKEY